ncbi:MAG TPA: hypothetical protein VJH33_03920 [Candidatus Paceibacterota bacterium]
MPLNTIEVRLLVAALFLALLFWLIRTIVKNRPVSKVESELERAETEGEAIELQERLRRQREENLQRQNAGTEKDAPKDQGEGGATTQPSRKHCQ